MRKALITGFAIGVALAVVGSVATPARATYPGANVSGAQTRFLLEGRRFGPSLCTRGVQKLCRPRSLDSCWCLFRHRTRLSIVDLPRTDWAAADPGESATFDFGPTDLVFARARETQ